MPLPKPLPPIPAEQLDAIVLSSNAVWEQGRHARILLTGGTGFVGTWLLELLCRANLLLDLKADVWVLSRNPAHFRNKCPHLANNSNVHLLAGDLMDFTISGLEFSHIIHGATSAVGPFAVSKPLEHLDTIVQGTRRMLDLAVHSGVSKFLYLSSGAVYGAQPSDTYFLKEDFSGAPDPFTPHSTYAHGKRMGEHLCALYSGNNHLSTVVARGFAFVGPHLPLDAHFAIGNFIQDALAGHDIKVNSDGSPVRSYLYGSEMAQCLWMLLFRGRTGTAYNVGSDQGIRLGDLARIIANRQGVGVKILGKADATIQPNRYVPSISRIKEEFGYEIRVDLEECIRLTLNWHRS